MKHRQHKAMRSEKLAWITNITATHAPVKARKQRIGFGSNKYILFQAPESTSQDFKHVLALCYYGYPCSKTPSKKLELI